MVEHVGRITQSSLTSVYSEHGCHIGKYTEVMNMPMIVYTRREI